MATDGAIGTVKNAGGLAVHLVKLIGGSIWAVGEVIVFPFRLLTGK